LVALDLDRVRPDEVLAALVVRLVLVRLRACAGLARFWPGVDRAAFLAGADLVAVSEDLAGVVGGVESVGVVEGVERVGADAGAELAGVGFGVGVAPVGVDVAVDGVLPAPFGVEVEVGLRSVGALSASVFAGAESREVVWFGGVAMRVSLDRWRSVGKGR
jgi:hypothetical protein